MRFRVLYELLAGGAMLVLAAQLVRGRSPSDLLGAYSIVGDRSYDPETVARFFLYHLAELDLYLGVLPFAAFVLLTLIARRSEPALAPFLAAALALTFSLLLVVAAFASEFANRIQERNTFVRRAVLPDRTARLGRPWATAAALGRCTRGRGERAAAACDSLGAIHRAGCDLGHAGAAADLERLRLAPLRLDRRHGGSRAAILAAALFLLVPRRWALALPAVALLFLAVVSHNVWYGEHGFRQASVGALFTGIRVGERDWIDRAVPKGTKVAFVWKGVTDRFAVNQNEFFNRTVGPVYFIGGPTPGGLAETEVAIDETTGEIRTTEGERVERATCSPRTRSPPTGSSSRATRASA